LCTHDGLCAGRLPPEPPQEILLVEPALHVGLVR